MLLLVILCAILKIVIFVLYVYFKILTRKSVVSLINWNLEKNTTLNTKGLKKGAERINMKIK